MGKSIIEILEGIPVSDEQIQKNTDAVNIEEEYSSVQLQIEQERLRKIKLRNERLKGLNADDDQDRKQRKQFALTIFIFVATYMTAVLVILFFCGFSKDVYGCSNLWYFQLSDPVIMTLLGTTTANVLGILLIVVKYLFSRKKK